MKNDRYSDAQIRTGQKNLAEFIQSLRNHGIMPPSYTSSTHPLGYMSADNIFALIVLRRNGGWVCDVVFNDVPHGFPDVTGTADSIPFASKQKALFAAQALVFKLLQCPKPVEDVAVHGIPGSERDAPSHHWKSDHQHGLSRLMSQDDMHFAFRAGMPMTPANTPRVANASNCISL